MGLVSFSFLFCAIAFLGLTPAFLVRRDRLAGTALTPLAMALTGLWAAVSAIHVMAEDGGWSGIVELTLAASALEAVRTVAWLIFLAILVRAGEPGRSVDRALVWGAGVVIAAAALAIANDAALLLNVPVVQSIADPIVTFIVRLGFAIAGLSLIENISRNVGPGRFWSMKFLCIGLAAIFAYDFLVYADALLFRRLDWDLVAARGAVALLAAPLLYLASRRGGDRLTSFALSRRFTVHTAALFGAGVYMVLMGTAGYYIRAFGGTWGTVLQATFVAAAAIVLLSAVFSGRFQSYVKVLISKHLFSYKYDYREEWLRFIRTLDTDDRPSDLRIRVVHAVANIIDSPGGGLWEWDEAAQIYVPTAEWNIGKAGGREPAGGSLAEFLAKRRWIVDAVDAAQSPDVYPGLTLPDWLIAIPRVWLVVPLVHVDTLQGFLVFQQARAPRELNWEDHDLLKTVGLQAASYLAERRAMRALADARELQMFNKRFAFVVHDIKTLISQLSLLLSNAEKHRDSPEFQRDLIASVRESVDSMIRILAQINAERRRGASPEIVDLVPLVRRAVARYGGGALATRFECSEAAIPVRGDDGQVGAVIGHLIQNAVEAASGTGNVDVRLRREGDAAVLEVADDGPGMTPEFVCDELFRPFSTTKRAGYGIGAYQCRELVRDLHGQLIVDTAPGRGTTMRVRLPLTSDNDFKPIAVNQ